MITYIIILTLIYVIALTFGEANDRLSFLGNYLLFFPLIGRILGWF